MARKSADTQRGGETSVNAPQTLPAIGFSRWEQLRQFIPVSRETWRKLVREGRAPQPQRWTERCTVYSNEEVHRWMKDPVGYQAQSIAA
ncbi:helix-turn-helix transcriptional regulator [Burkholderia arboris]|uniref:helix-turn-helix transcriptional regulator n=1 Tax=Burkholderia arboris TaxID=488730 RepID=UPI00210A6C6F|nr:transcriptional regulator [Burkholderia arboris]UTV54789.1 transcriptional regulator [Burkholderia arboris]